MLRTVVLIAATLACAQARPRVPVEYVPAGVSPAVLPAVNAVPSAQGDSGSNIVKSETLNPDGSQQTVVQQGSNTGGSASGGGFNVGSASSDTASLTTAEGTSSSSNTDAKSVQGAGGAPGFHGFPAGVSHPGFHGFPAGVPHPGFHGFRGGVSHPGFHDGFPAGSPHPGGHGFPAGLYAPGHQGFNAGLAFPAFNPHAQGTAGGQLTKSETLLPGGGKTTGVQHGAQAGGQASGGGSSVGSASSDTESQITAHGRTDKANTDARSQQGSSPGFHGFPGGVPFGVPHPGGHGFPAGGVYAPGGHQGFNAGLAFPAFNPHAQGTAGGNIVSSETLLPGGGKTTVGQHGARAGGQASGGGFNVGQASTGSESLTTGEGTSTKSDTDAVSQQGASPGFHGFPGGPHPGAPQGYPGAPQGYPAGVPFPGQYGCGPGYGAPAGHGTAIIPGAVSPHAQGTSGSQLVQSETIDPLAGSTTKTTQQGSESGGLASGGGFNVGQASTGSQSLTTAEGTSTKSDTDAVSQQGASPGFQGAGVPFPGQYGCPPGFGAPTGLIVPGGFGSPHAQGTAGGNILKSETHLPGRGVQTGVQHGATAGGRASGGGFSVGQGSSGTQSQHTQHGVSESAQTDSKSSQGAGLPAGQLAPIALGGPSGVIHGHGQFAPVYGHGQFGAGHGQFGHFGGFNPSLATAQGTSGSQLVNTETINPLGGTESASQLTAGSGGSATGGGFNVGRASGDTRSAGSPFGQSTSSDTAATSVQGSGSPALHGGLPWGPWQPFSNLGSATGKADSGLTLGKTTDAFGGQTTVTNLGSSAGGSAKDGGTNVSKASGRTATSETAAGTQTDSHVDSESIQTGR